MKKRLTVKQVIKKLNDFGFKWIRNKNEYKNHASKLFIIRLDCKHKFKRTYNSIVSQNNVGCPICNGNIGENRCREIFNKVFKENFVKVRSKTLNWLKTKDGSPMELDGYNDRLKTAFEYGNHIWHRNGKIDLKQLKKRDKLKTKLCKKYKVKLFTIKESNLIKNIFNQIIKQSKELNIKIPSIKVPKINLKNIYTSEDKIYWEKVINKAKKENFKIVSKNDGTGVYQKTTKQCKRGHISTLGLNMILSKKICCRECENMNKNINIIQKIKDWTNKNNGKMPSQYSKNREEYILGLWRARQMRKIKNKNINGEIMTELRKNNLEKLFSRVK